MKTKLEAIQRIASVIAIAIITLAIIGCKNEPAGEQPQKQPDTSRTLSFGTDGKVTITSDDQFTTTEWNTLCDKVVAAIERGYNTAPGAAKTNSETYFTENTVSVVLSKSATYDVEVKSDVSNTIYLKANASAIDGISDPNSRRLNGVGIKHQGFIRRTERGRGRACTDMTERVRTRRA